MTEITAVAAPSGAETGRTTGGVLGKDDFLELLTAQLRYQNPLNPMDDKDFIGQMAQFSSLEQMTNVATSLERLEFSSQVTESVTLIGRTVEWEKDGAMASGVVTSVSLQDGAIRLQVGEDEVTPSQVMKVL